MKRNAVPPGGVSAQIVRQLVRAKVTCAVCGKRYRLDGLSFLGHRDGVWAYMAVCGRCRTVALIGVVLQQGQPIIRDVTRRELKHFESQPPIGADDVLDMHELLEHFDGDFASLFQQP